MVTRCLATNERGERCQAQPVRASGYCYWHDPALAGERDRKRREGGANRSNARRMKKQLGAESLALADVDALLCVALKGVLAGRIEPGVGTAAATIAKAIISGRQATELEERLVDLERRLGARLA